MRWKYLHVFACSFFLGINVHALESTKRDSSPPHLPEAIREQLNSASIQGYYKLRAALDPEMLQDQWDNKNLAGTYYPHIPKISDIPPITDRNALERKLRGVFKIPSNRSVGFGVGVRDILKSTLQHLSRLGYSAVLPEDVYPVYQGLAEQAGMTYQRFQTVSELVLPEGGSEKSVMVLTSPLSPAGRPLSKDEVANLRRWLGASPQRRLVLDTVYTFDTQFDEPTSELLKDPKVLAIHSLAKAYALPGHLGFAVGDKGIFGDILDGLDSANPALAAKALALLERAPSFPAELKADLEERWKQIAPRIKRVLPGWEPPQNGYFSVVPLSSAELLEKAGVWSFPLSTFGSPKTGMAVISALPQDREQIYYVTILSNFARGFNKYEMTYSKGAISESTFKDKFFLLRKSELGIGLAKAKSLLSKTAIPGDRILIIGTNQRVADLMPNERNGRGRYINGDRIEIDGLAYEGESGNLEEVRMEDALADSFALHKSSFVPFNKVRPRSISILPVAKACQAKCKFCFSDFSVSAEPRKRALSAESIEASLAAAKKSGAERVVITGGGEPTLVGFPAINDMITQASRHFPGRITMITNGLTLAKLSPEARLQRMLDLDRSGLTVLAISRHHHDPKKNAYIMGIDTQTENVLQTFLENREKFKNLRLRLICVLQKSGVNSAEEVGNYVQWARSKGVMEVNFKELYVSTDRESTYANSDFNIYSETNRVHLRTVLDFARQNHWEKSGELPWGAPVFEKTVDNARMRIAVYTEPSVFWERTHGVARSWNLMADGKLLMSLEDGDTELTFE